MATTDTKLLLDDIIAAGVAQTYSPVDPSQLTTPIPGAGDGVAIAGLAIPVAGDTVQTLVVGLAGDDDKAVDAGRLFVVTEDTTSATAISYTIDGVTAGDAAGAAVATIADLNGDGLREIVVGAPGADNGAALNAGQTYVVWGQTATGGVDLGDASGDNGNGYSIFGEAGGDASGAAVAAIADGNGDGRQEVLVGAAGNDAGGADAGAAYVVFGRTNGTTDVSLSSLGSKGFKIIGENAGDAAGGAVAGIGDQNHDGKGDILVGAAGNDAGGNEAGAVYVVFNKASTAAVNLENVALGVGGYKIVGQAGEGAGATVADIGDVNGDRISDILVGTSSGDTAYVVFGKSDSTQVSLADVANGVGGFAIHGENPGDLAGISVAGGADFNGDGVNDLVIGAEHNAEGGTDAGAVYAIWGGHATGTIELSDVAASLGGAKIVGSTGALIGSDVALVGDVNGDGVSDIAIASAATHSVTTVYTPTDLWQPDPTVFGTAGDDIIGPGYGSTHKVGESADSVVAGAGDDHIETVGGNDTIDGGTGADTMDGGDGDDTYYVDNSGDVVIEQAGGGNDTVIVSSDWTLADNVENVQLVGAGHGLTGNDGANLLQGNTGNDRLDGGAGDDSELGGDGDDHLVSSAGHDTLVGGSGDDVYEIHGGSAHIEDFEGHNAIDASEATGDSYIDLSGDTDSEIEGETCDLSGGGTVTGQLDVQFLQDLTGSFADDIANVQSLIPQIVSALQAFQPTSEFGVSTFRDKPIDPFGAVDDWVYDTLMPLSTSAADLTAAYNAMIANNGNDGPEAQLEALMQLALRAQTEVGFQSNAARFVVLFTDAEFHVAGDGAQAGITTPNNGDVILDGNGLGEDYPLIDQVRAALQAANIVPIFAVAGNQGLEPVYQDLATNLGRGTVVTIAGDSSNVVQAITTGLTAATSTHIADAAGGAGNDHIIGNLADNQLIGNGGNDWLQGGDGNDSLVGGAGNDRLEGGLGTDKAIYSGHAADYQITTLANGDVEIREIATGDTDTLSGVEQAVFADTTVMLSTMVSTNTPPAISGPLALDIVEDDAVLSVAALTNASDADGNPLAVVLDATPLPAGVTFDVANQSFVVDPSDATFQSLGAGDVATITIDYGITDGTDTTQTSLTLTVTGTNDAAILSSADISMAETDTALTASGQLTISDVDSVAAFVVQTDAVGSYGHFSIDAAGNWSFVANEAFDALNPGDSVQDVFVVAAEDGTTSTVAVTVTGTAEALLITGDVTGETIEDERSIASGQLTAADRFGQIGAFVATTTPLAGQYGSLTINAAGAWTYVLDPTNPDVQALDRTTTLVDHVTVQATDGSTADIAVTIGGIEEYAGPSAPIYGTIGNDNVSGTSGDDVIYGLDGNDLITGGDGNDTIDGGWGRDSVDAGAGDDLIIVGGGTHGIQLASADPVDGGTGYDTVLLEGSQSNYHIVRTLPSGWINATDLRTGQTATFANIEALSFTDGSSIAFVPRNVAPVVSGPVSLAASEDGASVSISALANATDANHDTLTAVVDATTLPAGVVFDASTQSFTLDPANSAFQSLGLGQTSTVTIAYAVTDGALSTPATLTVTVTGTNDLPTVTGAVHVAATEGSATVAANALANASDVDSGDTLSVIDIPPTLPPGVTYDTLTGRFLLDPTNAAYAALAAGQTQDVIVNYSVSDGHGSTAAQVVFTVIGVGSVDPDMTVTGNSAANTLNGGSGNDAINGRAGADLMIGHAGNDTYTVDNIGDRVVEAVGEGNDIVLSSVSFTLSDNVENLTLTGSGTTAATGNDLDNVLSGNSGANILTGGLGNDTLTGANGNDSLVGGDGDDVLNGGSGNDTMVGGNGDDNYIVQSTADIVSEIGGSGHDIVSSSVTFSLSDATHAQGTIEDLILTGTSGIGGTGSSADNVITGNSGKNALSGLDGNDTLIGSGGNDNLTGGQGADHFVFTNVAGGIDTITDFTTGVDHIDISASGFGGGLTAGELVTLQAVASIGLAHGAAGHGYFILDNSGGNAGTVYYDATGGTSEDAVAIARIGSAALLASDFLVV